MQPINRRRALQLGGLGLAATIVGGVGLARAAGSLFDPVAGAGLVEMPALYSTGGTLRVRLEAAPARVPLAGREASTLSYNGGVPGPTLHLLPGDRLQIELVNRLTEPTNLHVHGLHVSPDGHGDNMFVAVDPGQSFGYDYLLPPDHRPGVYWYHPHHHGTVADQIFGGLYGAIVVEDPAPLPVARERILVVSDITLDGAGHLQQPSTMARMMGREGELVLVNGQVGPRLQARPGERERWRVVNACTARSLRLRMDGQQLQLLGVDSGRFAAPQSIEEVVLSSGNRADLLVTTAAGTGDLRALPYDRGGMSAMMGGGPNSGPGLGGMDGAAGTGPGSATEGAPVVLATLDVVGAAAAPLPPVPARPALRDLRAEDLTGRRQLTMGMGMGMGGGMRFTIDGKQFDPARTDHVVRVGTVEEWTITNTSPMDHPLHLHVWPMQLIEHGGQPVEIPTWQDVVNVPAGSSAKVRIAFDDFAGRTVYHCHILDHEDHGMMAVVEAR